MKEWENIKQERERKRVKGDGRNKEGGLGDEE